MKFLKEIIKQDVIAFLLFCFLAGACFVWWGDSRGWLHLSDGEKINSTVLWLTALAIFWYAYETYQLKKTSGEQAAIQEEIMLNEFLPILEPLAPARGAVLENSGLHMQIRNLGRGPAKCIEVYAGRLKL